LHYTTFTAVRPVSHGLNDSAHVILSTR
jgi:hypothetical protein